jgi:purine-binding chemotaxis protein CheW
MKNYLLFLLSSRVFAVGIQGAIEILPWRPLRTVPMSYSYVDGLLDYRGAVYPVFNLASRLGISGSGPSTERGAEPEPQSIILIEEKDKSFGIAAELVLRMTSLAEQPASPGKMRGVDPRYVKGYVADAYHEALILDFERLFHAN